MTSERTYYWEHANDESRYLRGSAREMARVAHRCGGEVGVIIDDGGPLVIKSVPRGQTVAETTAMLVQSK